MGRDKTEKKEYEGPPSSVRVFCRNASEMIDGLEDAGPGKKVTLKVRGEISSFGRDDYLDPPGASLELSPEKISIEIEDEVVSLDDAISVTRKKV